MPMPQVDLAGRLVVGGGQPEERVEGPGVGALLLHVDAGADALRRAGGGSRPRQAIREPSQTSSVMRSKLVRSGERITEALAEVDQGLHAEADGARLVVLPVLVLEHRPRDVEVRPGRALGHELAQEEAGGDGAGQAARPRCC